MPAVLGGCATYDLTKAPPAETQPIAITYSSEGPSGWTDLPLGAYRVPNSDVIVSGHEKGGIGMLFGVVGVLAQEKRSERARPEADVKGGGAAMQINLLPQAASADAEQLVRIAGVSARPSRMRRIPTHPRCRSIRMSCLPS